MTDDTITHEALAPCPFCGGSDLRACSAYVWCADCNFDGPLRNGQELAIAAWNTRATPDALRAILTGPGSDADRLAAIGEVVGVEVRVGEADDEPALTCPVCLKESEWLVCRRPDCCDGRGLIRRPRP